MKGFDSSTLLALLEGKRVAKDLLTRLRGVEIATTEMNLLELAYLAAVASPKARAPRRAAVERLRRKMTVLPVDSKAVEQASRRLGRGSERTSPTVLAMCGAFEANGCDELFTLDAEIDPGKWRFKITRLTNYHPG
jgi:predicted nucleic acid-binding protein